MQENRLKTFFVWMRNGISFAFTWLVILMLSGNYLLGIEMIATVQLIKIMLFVIGGVLLFTVLFSKCILRTTSFIVRLTSFMIGFGIYEGISFYALGIFHKNASAYKWIIFWGILVALYMICIAIYHIYSYKKGEVYTQALVQYQENRKNCCKGE